MAIKPKSSKTTSPKGKSPSAGPGNAQVNLSLPHQLSLLVKTAHLPSDAEDALGLAQELAFDAYEAPTRAERLSLAKEALAMSPLCADAFAILAEDEQPGSEAELDLLEKAVKAGEDALGPKSFKEYAGAFWGFIETRPYMRARHHLALALRERERFDEAATHLRGMLELNPNDNQGVRYDLMSLLQYLRREDELSALLKTYPEESAIWTYTDALASFRRKGATRDSAKRLEAALEANSHVPAFLLGRRKLPKTSPVFVGIGDKDEAVAYVEENREDWAAVDGALAWIEAAVPPLPKPPAKKSVAKTKKASGR